MRGGLHVAGGLAAKRPGRDTSMARGCRLGACFPSGKKLRRLESTDGDLIRAGQRERCVSCGPWVAAPEVQARHGHAARPEVALAARSHWIQTPHGNHWKAA